MTSRMADTIQVDVIDDMDVLHRHKDAWDEVYEADPQSHFFLSWSWLSHWLDLVSEPWIVLAARLGSDGAPYCAFFPIQLWSERGRDPGFINTIRMGGMLLAGCSGVLCNPRVEQDVVPALARRLLDFNWAGVYFTQAHMSEKRLALMLEVFEPSSFNVVDPPANLDENGIDKSVNCYVELPGDWETYLSRQLGSKMRAHARRYMRHLESGELRVTHATAETLERDLDTLYRLWNDRWGSIKSEQQVAYGVRYGRTMIERCFHADAASVLILWHDEQPVGVQVKYLDHANRTLICNMDGRDLNFKRPSPGMVLHFYTIRWAIENGFKIYDFQLGNDSYKYDLGAMDRRYVSSIVATRSHKNLDDRLDPRSLPSVFLLAQSAASSGDLENARAGCDQILKVDPKNKGARELAAKLDEADATKTHNLVAEVRGLAQQGAMAQATATLERALEAEPKNFDARLMMGLLLLQQGDAAAAEKHIRQALTINGKVAQAHYNYGVVLQSLGRLPKALKSFKKAIALRPDYPAAIKNRDQVARDMKRRV